MLSVCSSMPQRNDTHIDAVCIVTEHPYIAVLLLALGSLSLAKFIIKTLRVFAQTFILPGKSVRVYASSVRLRNATKC